MMKRGEEVERLGEGGRGGGRCMYVRLYVCIALTGWPITITLRSLGIPYPKLTCRHSTNNVIRKHGIKRKIEMLSMP